MTIYVIYANVWNGRGNPVTTRTIGYATSEEEAKTFCEKEQRRDPLAEKIFYNYEEVNNINEL